MKKNILYLIVLISLSIYLYKFYSEKKIEGVYLKYDVKYGNEKFSLTEQSILKIENGKFYVYFFGLKENPEILKFIAFGNLIHFTKAEQTENELEILPANITIRKFNKSELNYDNLQKTKTFNIRLPDSLKNTKPLILENRVFETTFDNVKDTIKFENELFYLKDTHGNWYSAGWEKVNINGFEIVLTGDGIVFVSNNKKERNYLYTLSKEKKWNKIELRDIIKR